MSDTMGDRLKSYENTMRIYMPRRCYTIVRVDGRSFHTFTKRCKRPFDDRLRRVMQKVALALCEGMSGSCFAYEQSYEVTVVMADFATPTTEAWFDNNLQKVVTGAAAIATSTFIRNWIVELLEEDFDSVTSRKAVINLVMKSDAKFDARAWTLSDPWEVYNTFLWRQNDATRNSLQMIAQSLYSHKELHGKKQPDLQEMIFKKGQNFNNFPDHLKRGSWVVYDIETSDRKGGWRNELTSPILSQNKFWFFKMLPLIQPPSFIDLTGQT